MNLPLKRRIRNAFVHRIERVLTNIYWHRHPGKFERKLWQFLRPLTLAFQPNDRWNLHVYVREWLKVLDLPVISPLPVSKSIFIFCSYRGEFTLNMILACLLAWRGHRVTIGYLPKLRSPIKHPREDLPDAGEYLDEALSCVSSLSAGRISCVDLMAHESQAPEPDTDYIELRARYDSIMALRIENIDECDPACAKEIEFYRQSGYRTTRAIEGFIQTRHTDFDLCIVPNGATFDVNHALNILNKYNLTCNCWDKFSLRNFRMLNHGNHVRGFEDIDLIWERQNDLGMNNKAFLDFATNVAMDGLRQRSRGVNDLWVTRPQKEKSSGGVVARSKLGIGEDEKIILICTNVPFDAGYDRIVSIFQSMQDWLLQTIRHLSAHHPDRKIVLRAHPDEERWGANATAESVLRQAGIDLSSIHFIPGSQQFNTYDLVEIAEFGVVFSSTIGLEMAMLGKPVLVGSEVYYAKKGFTVDPGTATNYLKLLSDMCEDINPFLFTEDEASKAQLFHYLLHQATLLPFPYDKPSGIQCMPPFDLVQSGSVTPYIGTIDSLAASRKEWSDDLGEYVGLNADNHLTRSIAIHEKTQATEHANNAP